jgi:hypothetical protein
MLTYSYVGSEHSKEGGTMGALGRVLRSEIQPGSRSPHPKALPTPGF